MSKPSVRLRGHVAVIVSQCDLLEDLFSTRHEIMARINVIRNAARRIRNTVEFSLPATEVSREDRCDRDLLEES